MGTLDRFRLVVEQSVPHQYVESELIERSDRTEFDCRIVLRLGELGEETVLKEHECGSSVAFEEQAANTNRVGTDDAVGGTAGDHERELERD